MFELGWLFWMLVIFLFAESWARVWAASHGSEPPSQGVSPPDAAP